jgi:hypothetical protein
MEWRASFTSRRRWDATYRSEYEIILKRFEPAFERWLARYDRTHAERRVVPGMVEIVGVSATDRAVTMMVDIPVESLVGDATHDLSAGDIKIYPSVWTLELRDRSRSTFRPIDVVPFRATGIPTTLAAQLSSVGVDRNVDWGEGFRGRRDTRTTKDTDEETLIGYVSLDLDAVNSLERFWETSQGLTVRSAGGYWRFLYFSVVVITTLGFGDIVPLTDAARLWVASESLLGVILIGLFLNSLGVRAAARQTVE